MYQILKDEYGFSKTGINSWWSDMVSKTRSALQTAVDGAQELMEPLTEALTAPADPMAAFDPQTFQVDVIEPSALPFQPMGLPDPELANVGFGMGEYFEQDAEAFVENYDVGDVLAAPEFTTVAQDEAFGELTRSNLQDQLISAPPDLEDDFDFLVDPPELDDAFSTTYGAWPIRFFVFDRKEGTLLFLGQPKDCKYNMEAPFNTVLAALGAALL